MQDILMIAGGLFFGGLILMIFMAKATTRRSTVSVPDTYVFETTEEYRPWEEDDDNDELLLTARREYPRTLDEYIGHSDITKQLKIIISNYRNHERIPRHMLFYGHGGLGKTTLSEIVADEVGCGYIGVIGEELQEIPDLVKHLDKIQEASIFFIDEVHNVSLGVKEYLYSILQDFKLNTGVEVKEFPTFTFIGATTNAEQLPDPLRQRITYQFYLERYKEKEIIKILPFCLEPEIKGISSSAKKIIAKVSHGTIRVARNFMLNAATDLAYYNDKRKITENIVNEVLRMNRINPETGLNVIQTRILETLSGGSTIGLKNLAFRVGVGAKELEDSYEPALLFDGYIDRTTRGRTITDKGLELYRRLK